jgi:hypothetical protein
MRKQLLIVSCIIFILSTAAIAADLPTQGKFKGIYYETRAGVGHFEFFIIPKKLLSKMQPYDGKNIELEVLKGHQPTNPGDVIIDEIGEIKLLIQPSLKVDFNIINPGSGGEGTFDILYSVKNTDKKDILFNAGNIQIGLYSFLLQSKQAEYDDLFNNSGYTYRQMSFGSNILHPYNFISPIEPGESNHYFSGDVFLRSNESVPFVLHNLKRDPGEYEIIVNMWYDQNGVPIPFVASIPFDIPLKASEIFSSNSLKSKIETNYEDEWLILKWKLINTRKEPVHIFAKKFQNYWFLPGLVQVMDRDGQSLKFEFNTQSSIDGPWMRQEINEEGIDIFFQLRLKDLFSRQQISKVTFWTITEKGIENVTLSEGIPARILQPLPNWGKTVHNGRLRIQLSKVQYRSSETIRIIYQAECSSKNIDAINIKEGHLLSNLVIEIDNKKLNETLISEGTHLFPVQEEINLQSNTLTPGAHKLKLSIKGDDYVIKREDNTKIRPFVGTLVSNEVEFVIKE